LTIRAALDWSVSRLSEAEQALFSRLAVFAGSFGPDAAAHVGRSDQPTATLDALIGLARKNLMQPRSWSSGSEPRFRLLEPMREYALDHLISMGEHAATRQLHAEFYKQFVDQVVPSAGTGLPATTRYGRWSKRTTNIRTALSWALDGGDIEDGLRLAC